MHLLDLRETSREDQNINLPSGILPQIQVFRGYLRGSLEIVGCHHDILRGSG